VICALGLAVVLDLFQLHVYYGGPYLKSLENCTGTGLNLFVFGEKLSMQNISEKHRCLQVAHEQWNFMGHSIPTQPVLPWAPSQILLKIAPNVPLREQWKIPKLQIKIPSGLDYMAC